MIAEEIRIAAKESGLSAYMIAKRTGLNKTIVVAFLAGRPTAIDKAEKIAAACGKSLRLGKISQNNLTALRVMV